MTLSADVSCSFVRHAKDTHTRPSRGTWPDLVRIMEGFNLPCPGFDDPKKGLPGILPAIFDPPHRGKEEAQSIQVLAFDFDNAIDQGTGEFHLRPDGSPTGREKTIKVLVENPVHPEDLIAAFRDSGIAAYAWSTWSNKSKAGWWKFRGVAPLAVPVPARLWPQATEWILSALGINDLRHGLDLGALRDTARLYFLPGHPDGPSAVWRCETFGTPLEVPLDQLQAVQVPPVPRPECIRREVERIRSEGHAWAAKLPVDLNGLRLADLLTASGLKIGSAVPVVGGVKYRAHCPFASQHSHGDDDGAVIHEVSGRWPTFYCSHSCHDGVIGLRDVLQWAGVA